MSVHYLMLILIILPVCKFTVLNISNSNVSLCVRQCLAFDEQTQTNKQVKFLWNYFRTHDIPVRWCTSGWTLGHRRRKGGGTGHISSPISLSNTFYTKLDQQITFYWTTFVAFYMSTELNVEYIDTNCRSNVAI